MSKLTSKGWVKNVKIHRIARTQLPRHKGKINTSLKSTFVGYYLIKIGCLCYLRNSFSQGIRN